MFHNIVKSKHWKIPNFFTRSVYLLEGYSLAKKVPSQGVREHFVRKTEKKLDWNLTVSSKFRECRAKHYRISKVTKKYCSLDWSLFLLWAHVRIIRGSWKTLFTTFSRRSTFVAQMRVAWPDFSLYQSTHKKEIHNSTVTISISCGW